MMFPRLRNRDTGETVSFKELSKENLAHYMQCGSAGCVSSSPKPWYSVDVRRVIAAKLLAGEL